MLDESTLLNKIVSAAIIGMLGWNVMATQQLAVDVEVLKVQTQAVITSTPTSGDMALLKQRVDRLEVWTDKLSGRVAVVEQTLIGEVSDDH